MGIECRSPSNETRGRDAESLLADSSDWRPLRTVPVVLAGIVYSFGLAGGVDAADEAELEPSKLRRARRAADAGVRKRPGVEGDVGSAVSLSELVSWVDEDWDASTVLAAEIGRFVSNVNLSRSG